jgi:hypothetical protein
MSPTARARAATRALKGRARREVFARRPELLYPHPPICLQPERLYTYLDALNDRIQLSGDIVEVGIYLGGTTAIASAFAHRLGFKGRYVCIDTFDGFVPDQFAFDATEHGVPEADGTMFDGNAEASVRRLLSTWHAGPAVELVKGDVVTMPESRIPEAIAVCLLDVDLHVPIYEGMKRLVPRLVPGGILLVDDCPPNTSWAGAKAGYEQYMAEVGIASSYVNGFGVLEAPIS